MLTRNGGDKGYDAALAAAALLKIMVDMPRMGFRRNGPFVVASRSLDQLGRASIGRQNSEL